MVIRSWLLCNDRLRLVTPLQSPDLNPMEYLFMQLGAKIRKINITSKNSLKEALIEAWTYIDLRQWSTKNWRFEE